MFHQTALTFHRGFYNLLSMKEYRQAGKAGKTVPAGKLVRQLRGLGAAACAPPSYHLYGMSSGLTAQPRNIIIWLFDHAPARYMHQRFGLSVCLRGVCRLRVDAEKFILKPGQGLLIFPCQSHEYVGSTPGAFLNFAVSFALENGADRSLEPLRNHVFDVAESDIIILKEMLAFFRQDAVPGKSEAVHLLARFLCRKLEERKSARRRPACWNLGASKYDRITGFINANIARPMTVKDIAQSANISTPHLRRIFKAHTGGLSVGHFIRSLRIKRAYELLVHSELNIAQVAENCGFSDPFVFSRAFKRAAGIAPLNYRKLYQGATPGGQPG